MHGLSTRATRRIWLFVLVSALVIGGGLYVLVELAEGRTTGDWPVWVVALATYGVTIRPIHVTTSSGRHSISLVEAILVLGLFTHDPVVFVLGTMLGTVPGFLRLRQPVLKLAVNLAQTMLWTVLPLLLFHGITAPVVRADVPTLAAALLTATVAAIGSAVTIKIPIGFASGRWRPRRDEVTRVFAATATALGAACIGLIGVALARQDVRLLALLVLPLLEIAISTGQQARDAERSRLFDFTVAASERLRAEPDPPAVLVDLLQEVRATFGVRHASLLLSSRGATIRVEADEMGTATVPGVAGEPLLRTWLAEHAAAGPALRVDDPTLGALADGLGTSDLLVAPLLSHQGDGALVLRDGITGPLRPDDGEFLRTIAANASAALERHALTDALDAAARREVELERRASHDALTGLANRSLFEREVAAALASEVEVTILYIDLNDFKQVNDVYGHASGDAVLVAAARRMETALRPRDVPARLGGDEFAVLLRREGEQVGKAVGDRILAAFDAPVEGAPSVARIAAAVGSTSSRPDDSVESLLHRADVAMYAAKRGRATSVVAG